MKRRHVKQIMHAIDTGGSGGAETVFSSVAASLDPARFSSVSVARPGGWLESRMNTLDLDSKFTEAKGSWNLSYLRFLTRTIRKNRVDLVHSHLLGSNVYCAIASLLTHRPMIAVFHGAHDLSDMGIGGRRKISIVDKIAAAIVVVSEDLKTEIVDAGFSRPEKIRVIYNGVDLRQYRPQKDLSFRVRLGMTEDDPLIGAVGNIRQPKAYDVLIDTTRLLADRFPTLKVVIAGDGNTDLAGELKDKVNQLGIEDRLIFLGHVPDCNRLYNNLDAYVTCSRSEGFSMTCVEAMACGVPVVATRSGGPQEIIDDRITGLLVEKDNPEDLAGALESTLSDPDSSRTRAANAMDVVRRKFCNETMVRDYERLYDEIFARTSQRDE